MPKITFLVLCALFTTSLFAQQDSTSAEAPKKPSKFDNFNEKAEHLFKIIPVPLYSYSTEAGHIFGLAKFNLFDMDKHDTICQPSKISEVVTFSSEGRVNISVSSNFIWKENKYMVLGFINYKKQDEYVLGIGNDVSVSNVESYGFSRFEFNNSFYYMLYNNLYAGLGFDIMDYTDITYDTTGILVQDGAVGLEANTNFGINLALLRDMRDNRYNPLTGYYFKINYTFFPEFLNNPYIHDKLTVDLRKYFNPWRKHVIALQATTTYCHGNVPFYDLAMLGGEDQMRGYYKGALRDNILLDSQVEYRLPIWKVFGATAWVGAGRVANSYSDLSLDGFWISYGVGFRIKVDSENNTNLRFDFGFGEEGARGFYINFAEAF